MNPETEEERPEELEVYKEVARRIRAARLNRGYTQDNLADRLGMKKAYIFQLERGNANPTLKTLVRVGFALGLEPADLMPRFEGTARNQPEVGALLSTCSEIIASITKKRAEQDAASARELELLSNLYTTLDKLASGFGVAHASDPPERRPKV
jgi:transcriptional regulator with XRE-family HTH domain